MLKPVLILFALLAPVAATAQADHSAEEIASAERAFAADGLAMGVKRSFLKWSTPDAILLLREPTKVHESFSAQPDPKPGEAPPLIWWPTWTGIARSGDLGISTGPVEQGGQRASHYFTVWKRQADGGWKWIYDGGVAADGADEPVRPVPAAHLPIAPLGSASPEQAMAEVRAAETKLAAAAARDQKAAHLAVLADDGRLYVAPRPPAKGRADFSAALDGWPATLALAAPLGGEASAAGDLVFAYGKADWAREGQARTGHYVHIWQRRAAGPDGWKLVFAQLLPAPPPPAGG